MNQHTTRTDGSTKMHNTVTDKGDLSLNWQNMDSFLKFEHPAVQEI